MGLRKSVWAVSGGVLALCAVGGFWSFHARAEREGERVVAARGRVIEGLRDLCGRAGLSFPPPRLFLRAFKREAVVEVWAGEAKGALRLLETMPVLASSGGPGPKRREGDRQVPEGFYEIDQFNPRSNFLLSMRVNYPNAADRVLSDREKPGGDIYIHGSDCSIGCLPFGDANIEKLYVLVLDSVAKSGRRVPVHLFPARMSGPAWDAYRLENPQFAGFWAELQPGYDFFEKTRTLPRVSVAKAGAYVVER